MSSKATGKAITHRQPTKQGKPPDKARSPRRKPAAPGEGFPVVGIGASAGGLEAYTSLLSKVPEDSGTAFVLIQHLDPSQPSRLTELLTRTSAIPVLEVTAPTRIKPDNVYVIPPGKNMIVQDHTLRLRAQPDRPGLTHSIDVFLRSLADDLDGQAVAIILSGTGSDGTEGARAVKAGRGLVIVQDPESAKYDGMPRAAISAGVADYVLPPEKMVSQLMEYGRKSPLQRDEVREALAKDSTGLKNLLSLVRARTGRDFSGYKVASITRRIERRMAVNKIETSKGYHRFLQEHPSEIDELMKDFLINVTSFFRDGEAFDALKLEITRLLSNRPEGSPLRAWIPGCSTGEEAYSIGILLAECVEESKRHYDIQVFGTDLNADTIAFARAGIYSAAVSGDISKERLARFFVQNEGSYQVSKGFREKFVFAVHDLVSDAPYSRMDIISIRNLLIYFGVELQKKIIPRLHYALNEGGVLFLGTAETIGESADLFKTVNSKWRIYRSINKRALPQYIDRPDKAQLATGRTADVATASAARPPFAPSYDKLLLEALPPSAIVNRNYEVIYTQGDTSQYLHLPAGNPTTRILDMAEADMRTALAIALREVSQKHKTVIEEDLRLKRGAATQSVKLTVRPTSRNDEQMIVTFEDVGRKRVRSANEKLRSEDQCHQLEQELEFTRETLRSTIEEMDTANEELRSANEEYTSTNEELKSTNEELETSREELRSVNEELTTVNTEREKKIEELSRTSDDMTNLLNSTEIATIFLDEQQRIRRFTPAAVGLFKLIGSDIGRPLDDMSSRLKGSGLEKDLHRVLETLVPTEREVKSEDGHWYSMKIHPYRTGDNAIEGVVATFVDISRIKAALAFAQGIVDTVREPMLVLDEDMKIISASRAFYDKFRVNQKETEGRLIFNLGDGQWNIPALKTLLKSIAHEDKVFEGYPVEHDFPGIGHRLMLLNARRVFSEAGSKPNILLAMEDATERSMPKTTTREKDPKKRKPPVRKRDSGSRRRQVEKPTTG